MRPFDGWKDSAYACISLYFRRKRNQGLPLHVSTFPETGISIQRVTRRRLPREANLSTVGHRFSVEQDPGGDRLHSLRIVQVSFPQFTCQINLGSSLFSPRVMQQVGPVSSTEIFHVEPRLHEDAGRQVTPLPHLAVDRDFLVSRKFSEP